MNFVHFLVLNMKKNKDRLDVITESLDKLNVSYTVVTAIDGFNMEDNEDVKKILKPVPRLLGSVFKSVETKRKWIYDGSISKSFPNLNLYGHYGTKGLTLSNIKALIIASNFNASNFNTEWFCILEDDAEIDIDIYNTIIKFIEDDNNKKYDIVLLDNRHNGWGGTSGMLYNKKIINQLIADLHPLSTFSLLSHKLGDKNLGNLWDWKLWKYVMFVNKNFTTLPCIPSGKFSSTIEV